MRQPAWMITWSPMSACTIEAPGPIEHSRPICTSGPITALAQITLPAPIAARGPITAPGSTVTPLSMRAEGGRWRRALPRSPRTARTGAAHRERACAPPSRKRGRARPCAARRCRPARALRNARWSSRRRPGVAVSASASLGVSRKARSRGLARSSGAILVMTRSSRAPARGSAPVSVAISPTVRPDRGLKKCGSDMASSCALRPEGAPRPAADRADDSNRHATAGSRAAPAGPAAGTRSHALCTRRRSAVPHPAPAAGRLGFGRATRAVHPGWELAMDIDEYRTRIGVVVGLAVAAAIALLMWVGGNAGLALAALPHDPFAARCGRAAGDRRRRRWPCRRVLDRRSALSRQRGAEVSPRPRARRYRRRRRCAADGRGLDLRAARCGHAATRRFTSRR